MGRWGPTQDDAAVGSAAAPGGTDDGARNLPPFHLDIDDGRTAPEPGPSPDDGDTRPWRRWFGPGLALVIGVVAGIVGADARFDAEERTRIDLVGGQTSLVRPSSPGTARAPWQAEFLVFNSGDRPVEIAEIAVRGWLRPEGGPPPEPTTAAPDTWTAVQTELVPDCRVEPELDADHRMLDADVTVHPSDGSATTIQLAFPPGQSWLNATWQAECAPADAPSADITIVSTEMLDRQPGVHSVRARIHLATSAGEGQGTIVRVWSHVPGFDFALNGVPATVSGEQTTSLEMEWEVASCAVAERLDEAQLGFHVAADANSRAARVQSTPVPAAVLVALGRLSAQVCGL